MWSRVPVMIVQWGICRSFGFQSSYGILYLRSIYKSYIIEYLHKQEMWQQKMNELVEGLSGVEVIADNFLICGFGANTREATVNYESFMTSTPSNGKRTRPHTKQRISQAST